jgi:thiosulfate/3-mercaptopyruvate sulfurtransferase
MIATLLLAFAVAPPPARPDTLLVSTSWLAERLTDPKVVVLHVGPRADYDSVHIPGARFIGMQDVSRPRSAAGPALELPDPTALAAALAARGVSDSSRIVLYWSSGWISPTTRIYLSLYWAGLGARTSILNGGLRVWRAEGRPVTAVVPDSVPGGVTVRPRDDVVVGAPWVAERLHAKGVAVVDARNRQFYEGRDTNHVRPGHLPGAGSLVFSDVVDTIGLWLPAARLRELFDAAGVAPGDQVIAYCHIGQQATAVWFAARLLGIDVRLYDGSFTEWTGLPAERFPVERSP